MPVIATHDCKVLASIGVKVRNENSTSNTPTAFKLAFGTSFQISEVLADMDDPTNVKKKWGRIFGGEYNNLFVALEYPNSAGVVDRICSYDPISDVPPTDPPVVHTYPKEIQFLRALIAPKVIVDGVEVLLPPQYYIPTSPITFVLDPNQNP